MNNPIVMPSFFQCNISWSPLTNKQKNPQNPLVYSIPPQWLVVPEKSGGKHQFKFLHFLQFQNKEFVFSISSCTTPNIHIEYKVYIVAIVWWWFHAEFSAWKCYYYFLDPEWHYLIEDVLFWVCRCMLFDDSDKLYGYNGRFHNLFWYYSMHSLSDCNYYLLVRKLTWKICTFCSPCPFKGLWTNLILVGM